MMREKPILFSGPMIHAILDGGKTQARRLPPRDLWDDKAAMLAWGHQRYGDPGDVLYVREAHAIEDCDEDGARLVYRADRAARWCTLDCGYCEPDLGEIFYLSSDYEPTVRWRPSIHMPKWASRIRLVRTAPLCIERLQYISASDIKSEGFESAEHRAYFGPNCDELRRAWKQGWDAINYERGSWSENPPVIVVSFRRAVVP